MLYPVLTESRGLMDLSGIWDFKLDDGTVLRIQNMTCIRKKYHRNLKAGGYLFNDFSDRTRIRIHQYFHNDPLTVSIFRTLLLYLNPPAV